MELQNLSSNWKRLQQTLPQDTLPKKRKASSAAEKPPKKRVKHTSKMGHLLSKPETSPTANAKAVGSQTSLQKSTSTVSLPQPLTDPTTHHPADKINAGLTANLNPGKYVAIDCEMVGVGPQPDNESALARVSLVDFNGVQLYDSFVQPKEAVTDFRTFVSGITPKLLREARSLEEVQGHVANLLKGRILVGHAIRNDLDAMMLGHPRRDTRDTSRYPGFRALAGGRTPGLRKLAKEVLGVDIQAGEHSSVEDARATMALFRKEKEGFEAEQRRRYGGAHNRKMPLVDGDINGMPSVDGDIVTQKSSRPKGSQNRKKKKKGKR